MNGISLTLRDLWTNFNDGSFSKNEKRVYVVQGPYMTLQTAIKANGSYVLPAVLWFKFATSFYRSGCEIFIVLGLPDEILLGCIPLDFFHCWRGPEKTDIKNTICITFGGC